MAIKTSLRFIARAISKAASQATANQNLTSDEYVLSGTFDEDSEHLSLLLYLITDKPVDERRLYAETLNAIRRAFPRDPQITMFIGLVIRKVATRNDYDLFQVSIGAVDETDITSLLERS
jgi:hypothetical protein